VLIVCDEGQVKEWRWWGGGRRWDPEVDRSEGGIKYMFFNWLGRQIVQECSEDNVRAILVWIQMRGIVGGLVLE